MSLSRKEIDELRIGNELEFFLNRLIPKKYKQVNHIVVVEKYEEYFGDGYFTYEIYVNPDFGFDVKDKSIVNPLFTVIGEVAKIGIENLNDPKFISRYINRIDFFYD